MTIRGRNRRVTFKRPFAPEGLEGVDRSDTYSVETCDECTGLFSILNAKHASTRLRIYRNPGIARVLLAPALDEIGNRATAGRSIHD